MNLLKTLTGMIKKQKSYNSQIVNMIKYVYYKTTCVQEIHTFEYQHLKEPENLGC